MGQLPTLPPVVNVIQHACMGRCQPITTDLTNVGRVTPHLPLVRSLREISDAQGCSANSAPCDRALHKHCIVNASLTEHEQSRALMACIPSRYGSCSMGLCKPQKPQSHLISATLGIAMQPARLQYFYASITRVKRCTTHNLHLAYSPTPNADVKTHCTDVIILCKAANGCIHLQNQELIRTEKRRTSSVLQACPFPFFKPPPIPTPKPCSHMLLQKHV